MNLNEFLNLLSQARNCFAAFVVFWLVTFWTAGFLSLGIACLAAIIVGILERKFMNKRAEVAPKGQAVFITGCSSGIGLSLAKRLAEMNFYVFAGVRKEADGEKVKGATKSPDNIHPVICDVCKEDQVIATREEISKVLSEKNLQLLSLVNNAGYGEFSPVEVFPLNKVRNQLEVNVVGLVSVTQKMLPVLRKFHSTALPSRIINISSGAGLLVFPQGGAYSASKYAVEAISDALRMELKPFNIKVALVEPGRFATGFQGTVNNNQEEVRMQLGTIEGLEDNVKSHYEECMKAQLVKNKAIKRPSVEFCTDVIVDAVMDSRPLPRYFAGSDVQFGIPFAKSMHEFVRDNILGKGWNALRTAPKA